VFGSHEHHIVGNACDAEVGNVQGLGVHIAVEIVIEQFAELGGIDVLGFPSIIGISNAGHACKVVCFPISRGERGESWRDSFTFQSSITIQLRPHPARMLVPLSFSAGNGFCFSYTLKTSAAAICATHSGTVTATHSGTVMKIMNFCFRSCGDRPLISSSEFFYVDDKARCLLLTPSFSRGTIRVLRLSEEQFPTVGSAAPP